ncbi:hypothetical protein JB92DRAFT_2705456 [Gautieria morchelliformis]|nr:hypothetical protein JB92DRAFT_2705456 [Gautieria morchelliformis]
MSVRIECGCCSDDSTPFIAMMQCPDGHLFCKDCVRMQAETVIGNQKTEILCMDQSDCKLPFTTDILSQCLDDRTIALWDKLRQAKDIRDANLEGLEDCPFCDYALIIPLTVQQLPVFDCAKCKNVSCRRCKKKGHAGRPCHDQSEDAKLKAEHAVEEAMTQALLRVCPRCKAPFIKDHGCNKMKCSTCQIYVCYVCRKQITDPLPYQHFNVCPFHHFASFYSQYIVFQGQGANVPGKCPLYDDDGSSDPRRRHAAEVCDLQL